MFNLAVAIFLVLLLHLRIKKALEKTILKAEKNYSQARDECARLKSMNLWLKKENTRLVDTFEKILALYDVTEEICRTLDADKVFAYFRQEVDKYIPVGNCKFIKGKVDQWLYPGATIVPLQINKNLSGYLIADGVREEDKEKFYILTQQFILGAKRAILYQEVQELAITDSLTGIFNRRYYLERFEEELERSRKFGHYFSCLMLDIDRFKDYNDRYGHLVGDVILVGICRTIKENIRQIDMLSRYGGEEFSVILSETGVNEAKFAAERIRQAIEQKPLRAYDEELRVAVSIGIATYPGDGTDVQSIIDNADSALYRAKKLGRNRVCVYSDSAAS